MKRLIDIQCFAWHWVCLVCLCLNGSYNNVNTTTINFEDLCRFEGMCLNCSQGDCDDMCQFYDNKCCRNTSSRQTALEKWQYSCVRKYPDMYDLHLDCRGSVSGVFGVLMVSKCSNLWNDEIVQSECENSSNTTLLSRIPVYDKLYETVTYKNMFCAICNWLSFDRLRFWKFDLLCNIRIPTNVSYYDFQFDQNVCFIRLVYRPHRMCAQGLIETCGSNSVRNSSLRDQCENGLSQNVYVWRYEHRTFSVYKNEFCAQCNGESGKLQCWAHQAFTCWPRDLPPYTLVKTTISLNFYGQISRDSESVFNDTCGAGVLYDPFEKSCLNITCFQILNTCISGICNLVELENSEFAIQNDSLLFHIGLDASFQRDRYFIETVGVYLCLDDNQFVDYLFLRQTTLKTTETSLNVQTTVLGTITEITQGTKGVMRNESYLQTLFMLLVVFVEIYEIM